jgi:hypothetical protein
VLVRQRQEVQALPRRLATLAAALALLAAGCGGDGDDLAERYERDLVAGKVAGVNVPVRGAECGPVVEGAVDCRADVREHDVLWLRCFDGDPDEPFGSFCGIGPAPVGAQVFTTELQRSAPKFAAFECEEKDELGNESGYFSVELEGDRDRFTPAEEHGWMTRAEAAPYARRLGLELVEYGCKPR